MEIERVGGLERKMRGKTGEMECVRNEKKKERKMDRWTCNEGEGDQEVAAARKRGFIFH